MSRTAVSLKIRLMAEKQAREYYGFHMDDYIDPVTRKEFNDYRNSLVRQMSAGQVFTAA